MFRLLAIILFIYLLYMVIKFAIRRSMLGGQNSYNYQNRNFNRPGSRAGGKNYRDRFDHIEDAEYEEVKEPHSSEGSASKK